MQTLKWKRVMNVLKAASQSGYLVFRIEKWTYDYRLVVNSARPDMHSVHISIRRDKQLECKRLAETLLEILEVTP